MTGLGWRQRGQWVADSVVHGSLVQVHGVAGNVTVHAPTGERPLYRVDALPTERPKLSAKRARNQPARLLQVGYAVIDFIGRHRELEDLAAWRDSDDAVSTLLLHGAGGQGKTRLASQFAWGSRDLGWRVLQGRHASDPAAGVTTRYLSLPVDDPGDGEQVLMVVDYAERWPTGDLLELLTDATRQARRARVLLVARPAGVWWQNLSNDLDRMEIETDELALGPLADDAAASPAILFAAARDRFARELEIPDITGRDVPLSVRENPEFRQVLAVHMAALAVVDESHQPHGASRKPALSLSSPAEVSAYLLRRERAHWDKLHAGGRIRVSADALGQAAYTAALIGPRPYADGLVAIDRVEIGSTEPDDRVLKDHAIPYPVQGGEGAEGDTVLEPLYPDRLAEDFLALMLPGHHLAHAYTPDPWSTHAPRRLLSPTAAGTEPLPSAWFRGALAVLAAAASRWPHVTTRQLAPLLQDYPQLAVDAGGATLATLARLPDLGPAVLEGIEPHLPKERHTDLDPGIAAVAQRLTSHRLAHTQDPLERARLCDRLATRLSYAGLHKEAVEVSLEALQVWGELAQVDPSYGRGFARALGSLGISLADVGQHENALRVTQDAVLLFRRLVEADAAAYEPDLAVSLSNLGQRLWQVGRPTEALESAQEALAVYRRLAAAEPAAYEDELGLALNNLGLRLWQVRRPTEALTPTREAIAVYRRLAAANPAAHEPALALMLLNLGAQLWEVGRSTEALTPTQEAVASFRRLTVANAAVFEHELAKSLANLGVQLSAAGRSTEATAPTQEALTLYRRLAAANPAVHEPELAMALINIGARLWEVGRSTEAIMATKEAIAVYRRLAAVSPAAYEPRLATALDNLGSLLSETGRPADALAPTQEAITVHQRLAAADAAVYEPELARALINLGTHLWRLSRSPEAIAPTQKAADICRRFVAADPAVHEPDLARALHNLGVQLSEAGRLAEALAPAQEAAVIQRRLDASRGTSG